LPGDLACSTLDCHYWDPCTQNWYSKQ
jgi:hypothetical protein